MREKRPAKMGNRVYKDWALYKPEGARVPIYDLRGLKFGRWTVVELASPRPVKWLCRCECGTERLKRARAIISDIKAHNYSCGCIRKERFAKEARTYKEKSSRVTHGDARKNNHSRLYRIWASMRRRCANPSHPDYADYGGKGVSVFPEWEKYERFREWALTHGYNSSLSIDRIDPSGDYEPTNCRWATPIVQASNKRHRSNTGVIGVSKIKGRYHASLRNGTKLWQKTFATLDEACAYREGLERKCLSSQEYSIIRELNRRRRGRK